MISTAANANVLIFNPDNDYSIKIDSKLIIPQKCVFCDAEINYSTVVGFNVKDNTIGPVCLDCRKKLTKKHVMAEMI